jgi:hypothetical protein
MEMVGSIARVDAGGAFGRRSGAAPVAAVSHAGGSGEGRGQRGGTNIAKQADEAAAQAKAAAVETAPRREAAALPPAVQIDGLYEKRVGNGPDGLYIDLVYKNGGMRAVRLVGRSEAPAGDDDSEQSVAAAAAARAYQAALGSGVGATTELTG